MMKISKLIWQAHNDHTIAIKIENFEQAQTVCEALRRNAKMLQFVNPMEITPENTFGLKGPGYFCLNGFYKTELFPCGVVYHFEEVDFEGKS